MPTPTTSSGDAWVRRQLAEAFAAFGPAYKRWVHARLGDTLLRYTHFRALDVLACHGPQIMRSLGDELGITPRYVTVLVDALEADGLVRRRPHPSDRRVTIVELTQKGELASATPGSAHTEANAELLGVLTVEQQRELLSTLHILLRELQKRGFAAEPDRPAAA